MYSWALARDGLMQEAGEGVEHLFYEMGVNIGASGGWNGWPPRELWGRGRLLIVSTGALRLHLWSMPGKRPKDQSCVFFPPC